MSTRTFYISKNSRPVVSCTVHPEATEITLRFVNGPSEWYQEIRLVLSGPVETSARLVEYIRTTFVQAKAQHLLKSQEGKE